MNKKILKIIFTVFVWGAMVGIATNPPRASAGFLQDFFNRLLPGFFSAEPSEIPITGTEGEQTQAPAPVVPYAPTIDYEEAVVKAVEESTPSVVSIIISKNLPVIEQCPYDPFANLPPEMKQFFGGDSQFYQPCQKGTKLEKVGGGSGFIISSDGLILTNKHVVADTKAEYTVLTNDEKKYTAHVLARDPLKDLAIIKIEAANLPTVILGDSSAINVGQTAVAIGNALGEFRNTVSVGII